MIRSEIKSDKETLHVETRIIRPYGLAPKLIYEIYLQKIDFRFIGDEDELFTMIDIIARLKRALSSK